MKANQPKLHAQLRALPWREVPALDIVRGKGHGRAETRIAKITAVSAGLGFPHATTAIQITRRRRPLSGKRWKTETVYAISDLDRARSAPTSSPTSPADTGTSKTGCTGSATSPSPKTARRSAPDTAQQ